MFAWKAALYNQWAIIVSRNPLQGFPSGDAGIKMGSFARVGNVRYQVRLPVVGAVLSSCYIPGSRDFLRPTHSLCNVLPKNTVKCMTCAHLHAFTLLHPNFPSSEESCLISVHARTRTNARHCISHPSHGKERSCRACVHRRRRRVQLRAAQQ